MQLQEDMEKQVALAHSRIDELTRALQNSERQVATLREDQLAMPVSDMELLFRHQRQTTGQSPHPRKNGLLDEAKLKCVRARQ